MSFRIRLLKSWTGVSELKRTSDKHYAVYIIQTVAFLNCYLIQKCFYTPCFYNLNFYTSWRIYQVSIPLTTDTFLRQVKKVVYCNSTVYKFSTCLWIALKSVLFCLFQLWLFYYYFISSTIYVILNVQYTTLFFFSSS